MSLDDLGPIHIACVSALHHFIHMRVHRIADESIRLSGTSEETSHARFDTAEFFLTFISQELKCENKRLSDRIDR